MFALPEISAQPVTRDREANGRGEAVLAWLEAGTPYGTRVLWGPSYTLPNWIYEPELSLKDVPSKAVSWSDVNAFAQDRELEYAILDWEMVQRREQAFAPYFRADRPLVRIERLPPTWAVARKAGESDGEWLVFRLLDVVPPRHVAEAVLGDGEIELLGYDLHSEVCDGGRNVYVTLYWRALRDGARNLSVLVHLLDEAGELIAQGDGWPLEGRFPTSSWRAGDLVADRHTITVPAGVCGGLTHQLAVGMYLPETVQRIPLRQGNLRSPSDRLLLALPSTLPD
jgi:hypothetical protein